MVIYVTLNVECVVLDASTSWYKDAINPGIRWKVDYDYFWTNNDNFGMILKRFLPHIEDVYFAGGEPFVQEGHYKLLDKT